jgi:hypothetical protein
MAKPGPRWTDAEIALLREKVGIGLTYGEIAEYFPGRKPKALESKASKMKLSNECDGEEMSFDRLLHANAWHRADLARGYPDGPPPDVVLPASGHAPRPLRPALPHSGYGSPGALCAELGGAR